MRASRLGRRADARSAGAPSNLAVEMTLVARCDRVHAERGMMVMTMKNDTELRLRDLRVLSVVLREHNLTRAAELLDTTQPSISKVLARLRGYFADPLFIRDGNAMRPTPRALEIAGPLHGLLVASDGLRMSEQSFDTRNSDRVFKLLVTDVGMIVFLPPLMSRMAREGSKLSLHAVPLDSRHFESKLESGEADLALGAFPKAPRGLRRQYSLVKQTTGAGAQRGSRTSSCFVLSIDHDLKRLRND
jgi:Bacterial regulatory helix-turn-helix protein, lysR family